MTQHEDVYPILESIARQRESCAREHIELFYQHRAAITVADANGRAYFDRAHNEYRNWTSYNPLQDSLGEDLP